jgi:hypothetical protein
MFAYRRVFLAVCVFCFGHAKALEPAKLYATVCRGSSLSLDTTIPTRTNLCKVAGWRAPRQ